MPRKKDAVVLGRCPCETCGASMAILQNVRGNLYSRCPNCKTDQRTGPEVQAYKWHNTVWLNGEPEQRPRNVPEKQGGDSVHEPDEPEKTTEKQSDKKKAGIGLLLVPIGILAAVIIGVK